MGGKQSTVGDVSIPPTPVTDNIQAAYKSGDTNTAQDLIKTTCEENILQVEKVGQMVSFIGTLLTLGLCLQSRLFQTSHSLVFYACILKFQTGRDLDGVHKYIAV